MKIVKILLGVVVLLALLLLTHPFWLASVAKGVANSVVPGKTKTEFNLGQLAINAYNGKVFVGDLLLGNPQGYDEPVALKVGSVDVLADTASLSSDVIRLKEVVIKDVFVCYTRKDGMDNFSRISKNASNGSNVKKESSSASSSPAEEKTASESAKVIIDRLDISGIVVKFGPVALPVPPIVLTGVGEKSNGVTLTELGSQLLTALMDGAGALKDGMGAIGALFGEGTGALGENLKKGDMKAVKEAASLLKSMFK